MAQTQALTDRMPSQAISITESIDVATRRRRSLYKSVGVLVGGTAFVHVLSLLIAPILTRLYVPSDFGVFAVYFSIISVLLSCSCVGLEVTIPLPRSDSQAVHLVAAALVSTTLLTTALAAASYWLIDSVAIWLNWPALADYSWLLALSLLLAGVYQTLNHWAIRKKAFGPIAATRISQGVSKSIAQLMLGALHAGPLGLVTGDLLGRAGGNLRLVLLILGQPARLKDRLSLGRMKLSVVRYRQIAWMSCASAVLTTCSLQLPPVLMTAMFGLTVAGWFALAMSAIQMPVSLVMHATSQVYFSNAAELVRSNPRELRRVFHSTWQMGLLASIIPALALVAVGPNLFAFVFGRDWASAGTYARILSILLISTMVASPLGCTLTVMKKQGQLLVWNIGRLVLVGLAFAGCSLFRASDTVAVVGFTGVASLSYLVLFVMSYVQVKRASASDEVIRP